MYDLSSLADQMACQMIGWCYAAYMRLVFMTSALSYAGCDDMIDRLAQGRGIVAAITHQDAFVDLFAFRGHDACVMLTQHPSADAFALLCRRSGFQVVRGSSDSGGSRALHIMIRLVREQGKAAAIIVDGPNGPTGRVKRGVVSLARHTDCPIFPIRAMVTRKIVLGTWDRRVIPLPFSRLVLRAGQPIYVPRHSTDTQQRDVQARLERELEALSSGEGGSP